MKNSMYKESDPQGELPPNRPIRRDEIAREIRELNEVRYDSLESQNHVYYRINELIAELDTLEAEEHPCDAFLRRLEAEEALDVVKDAGDIGARAEDSGKEPAQTGLEHGDEVVFERGEKVRHDGPLYE